MKALGITRRLDDLGRITIPMELRRSLRIDAGDKLDISEQDKLIVLESAKGGCLFSRKLDDLGRLCIPRSFLKRLRAMNKVSYFQFYVQEDKIFLQISETIEKCDLCGAPGYERPLQKYKKGLICEVCIEDIARKFIKGQAS